MDIAFHKSDIRGPKGRFRFIDSHKYIPGVMNGDRNHELNIYDLLKKNNP